MWGALPRGVTPVGKNRIPKMSYVKEILTQLSFIRTFV